MTPPRIGQAEAGVDSRPEDVPIPGADKAQGLSTTYDLPAHPSHGSREHIRSPARGETRRATRRRSIDLVAEANGDVEAFVQELDQKRKELDEHIHKFIAQKEREFRRYEQEIRKKYQNLQPPESQQRDSAPALNVPVTTSQVSPNHTPEVGKGLGQEAEDAENIRSRIDRKSANSGLEDVRPSYEREKDFMGLFTPSFLPLLDGKPDFNRSPSAPPLSTDRLQSDRQSLQRSNTEPILDANGNARPKYGQRSSSASGGLVSALKSSGGKKHSKPMRVMLQLADDQPAVHPNDDLPTEREYAPMRQAEAMHHSKKTDNSGRLKSEHGSESPSPTATPEPASPAPATVSPIAQVRSNLTYGLASTSINSLTIPTTSVRPGDKAEDFEDVASPFPLDEEVDEIRVPEPDWEVDFQEDIGQDSSVQHLDSPVEIPPAERTPTDMSPEPDVFGSLSTPVFKIRSASSSSGQPISPGFSRPSVREDPKFDISIEDNEEAEDTLGQGSLYDAFARPSVSKNTMTGSLGESYMQRNAEAMMRRRRS